MAVGASLSETDVRPLRCMTVGASRRLNGRFTSLAGVT